MVIADDYLNSMFKNVGFCRLCFINFGGVILEVKNGVLF